MEDVYGDDGGFTVAREDLIGDSGGNARFPATEVTPAPLTVSFREGRSSSRRRAPVRPPSLDADDFMSLMHGSDPVKVELNRLENEVRDKDRELGEAQAEIKALKLSERLREKAVEELTEELEKVDEKLKLMESLLESKNLEIKKINDEKKASMAAQFAAEATLRRVHAAQKDDDMPPIEAILAPLEAELKLARQEIAKLQDDNKALDRLTKSKEAALLEAERTVQVALAKASMRDRKILKQNLDLLWKMRKNLEYFLKTNRILMEPLHQDLCTAGVSNTVARACSAGEQLNDVIKILESRMTHETIQLSKEKQIVREIDKLRGMKSKFIACDAGRAEIRDAIAKRDSLMLGDKEKLIGTEMDIVSKELQLVKEQIRHNTVQKQCIAKNVETWDQELKILEEKKNKAGINVQELENKMKAPYENNRELLNKAKELAAENNAEALKELSDSEVNKFMFVYSSDKEFRESYATRILPSLESRQLSRDGRRMNPNEKSVMVQETTEMVRKPKVQIATNRMAMLKKEEQVEKRVAREARRAERGDNRKEDRRGSSEKLCMFYNVGQVYRGE